jgi:hypothetical protein
MAAHFETVSAPSRSCSNPSRNRAYYTTSTNACLPEKHHAGYTTSNGQQFHCDLQKHLAARHQRETIEIISAACRSARLSNVRLKDVWLRRCEVQRCEIGKM